MRISDWSSDVCSSDLLDLRARAQILDRRDAFRDLIVAEDQRIARAERVGLGEALLHIALERHVGGDAGAAQIGEHALRTLGRRVRSEEHTSELQSLMRISYAVFCLKKKKLTYETSL